MFCFLCPVAAGGIHVCANKFSLTLNRTLTDRSLGELNKCLFVKLFARPQAAFAILTAPLVRLVFSSRHLKIKWYLKHKKVQQKKELKQINQTRETWNFSVWNFSRFFTVCRKGFDELKCMKLVGEKSIAIGSWEKVEG